jgi:hypothetical protein
VNSAAASLFGGAPNLGEQTPSSSTNTPLSSVSSASSSSSNTSAGVGETRFSLGTYALSNAEVDELAELLTMIRVFGIDQLDTTWLLALISTYKHMVEREGSLDTPAMRFVLGYKVGGGFECASEKSSSC